VLLWQFRRKVLAMLPSIVVENISTAFYKSQQIDNDDDDDDDAADDHGDDTD